MLYLNGAFVSIHSNTPYFSVVNVAINTSRMVKYEIVDMWYLGQKKEASHNGRKLLIRISRGIRNT